MMPFVRTTVTLDPDVEALVRRRMRERIVSFKEAVNDAIRAGASETRRPVRQGHTPEFSMGHEPAIPWDKALRLAADLDDEELIRRLSRGR
jgi:hypothetical protein